MASKQIVCDKKKKKNKGNKINGTCQSRKVFVTLQNLSEKNEGSYFIFETCLMAVAGIPGF